WRRASAPPGRERAPTRVDPHKETSALPPISRCSCLSAQQLCGSAAQRLHLPAARREASRETRRGSAGPTNAAASAATASWAARREVKVRLACAKSVPLAPTPRCLVLTDEHLCEA